MDAREVLDGGPGAHHEAESALDRAGALSELAKAVLEVGQGRIFWQAPDEDLVLQGWGGPGMGEGGKVLARALDRGRWAAAEALGVQRTQSYRVVPASENRSRARDLRQRLDRRRGTARRGGSRSCEWHLSKTVHRTHVWQVRRVGGISQRRGARTRRCSDGSGCQWGGGRAQDAGAGCIEAAVACAALEWCRVARAEAADRKRTMTAPSNAHS